MRGIGFKLAVTCFAALALLVALNVAVAAWLAAFRPTHRPTLSPPILEALRAALPDLSDEDVHLLGQESARTISFEPYTHFRETEFSGRYVTVRPEGFRATTGDEPWPPDPRRPVVFLFGGSTAFGYGVPDDQTIAAHLQRGLSADGIDAQVYNFGRGSYFSSQERILFERLLVAGMVPDVAVFLDGLNDFHQAGVDEPAGADLLRLWMERRGRPEAVDFFEALPLGRLFIEQGWYTPARLSPDPHGRQAAKAAPGSDDAAIDRVLQIYRNNARLIRAAAEAFGVEAVFVWQPVPHYKRGTGLYPFGDFYGPHELSRHGYPHFAEERAADGEDDSLVWCADLQEGDDRVLYVDRVHYSPYLSGRVADCMLPAVRAGLR